MAAARYAPVISGPLLLLPLLLPLLLLLLPPLPAAGAAAAQCRRVWQPGRSDSLLSCRTPSLLGALPPPASSVGRHQPTRRLHLRCVESGTPHGPVPPAAFRQFPHLLELRIEQCLVPELARTSLEGLNKLENLTFRTNGVEWSTAATLRLRADSFSYVPALRWLDLGGNNLWSLPAGVFCPLQKLVTLNLTNNRLADISNVTVTAGCALPLRQLDVSGNRLTSLTPRHLSGLARLTWLRADRNQIAELGDGLLKELPTLQVLNISHNQLTALPPDALHGSAALAEVHLQNNRLRVLAPGSLTALPRLQVLDLSWNRLSDQWVSPDTVAKLPELVVLRLAHNNLTRLDSALFKSIPRLQVLMLNHNGLQSLPEGVFASLKELTDLHLDQNLLTTVSAEALAGLLALTTLSLKDNRVASINGSAFVATPQLRSLTLADNQLQQVPDALVQLTQLKALDLSRNRLLRLEGGALSALLNLFALELEGNQISELTTAHLGNMSSLRALNLAQNAIPELPTDVFDGLENLQMLRLDSNLLTSLSGPLHDLESLRWLNASANLLAKFDYADVPRSLAWLDLHGNRLTELSNSEELERELALTTIDVSYNRLTALSPFQLPDNLQTLIANDNNIGHVYPYTFFRKPNISRVDLFANQITTIDSNAFRLNLSPGRQRPQFYIGGNPILCDCRMAWLADLQGGGPSPEYPLLMDEESLFCRLVFGAQRDYMPLVEVARSQFLCRYDSHCAALCQCCQFDACDCEMACPANCTCYRTDDWSGNIVDCTAAGYSQLPEYIPMDATELYLDGNQLPQLGSHAFLGRHRLLVLYLNNSRVHTITNRSFSGLTSLQVLHLEHNQLVKLHGFEFEKLLLLRELYLNGNAISVIANETFAALTSLRVLRLDGNRLLQLRPLQLAVHPHLSSLNISDNRLSCRCQLLAPLARWLEEAGAVVVDASQLVCYAGVGDGAGSLTGPHPILGPANTTGSCELYNGTSATRVGAEDSSNDHIFIVCVSILAAVVVAVVVVVCVFWHEMRVMAYAKYGVRIYRRGRGDADKHDGKLFDAFISYSIKDEPFVEEVLARRLEGVQLCLHHRDLEAAPVLAADTIVRAVESSRRTIVVLSDHFVQSEWARCEVRSALQQALAGRASQLIVVVLNELSPRLLDADLRLYMKTGAVLHWRHALFWHKLWYELPDVPQRRRRGDSPPVYEYPMAVHI